MELESKNIIKATDESSVPIRSACTAGSVAFAPQNQVATAVSTLYKDAWRRLDERGYTLPEVERHECWIRKILEAKKERSYELHEMRKGS
jgi:hypothetical protein